MSLNIAKEVAALGRMTVKDLRAKHVEVFGEATRSGNKDWLRKRIGWRIQANAHGDLSERAIRRAEELANDADLRMLPPRDKPCGSAAALTAVGRLAVQQDDRPLMPGTVLTRPYTRTGRSACWFWTTASSTKARSTGRSLPSPRW